MNKFRTVWKIRRRSDGWFSEGGQSPRFHPSGREFTKVGALKNHLRAVQPEVYDGCDVVEYHLRVESEQATPAGDYLEEVARRKAEQRAATEAASRAETEAYQRQQYERLKAKFEPKAGPERPLPDDAGPHAVRLGPDKYCDRGNTYVYGRRGWRQLGVYDG